MKKITYLLAIFLVAQTTVFAQYTAIPDAAFEAALSPYDDIPMDGQIPTANAVALMGELVVNNQGIVDFTGIEAFTNISGLNINDNIITSIDLTSNTLLASISMIRCKADNIDITGLTALTNLNLRQCDLSSLDLSTNTILEVVDLRYNELTELDLSNNLLLTDVDLERQTDSPTDSSPYNTLINVDLNGANRSGVSFFNADFNYSLTCVFVDDMSAPYGGWALDGTIPAAYCTGSLGTEDRRVSSFSMYPNPTKNLVLVGSRTEVSTLDVYSISGKLILTKELTFGSNNVDITSLSSGIYLARFSAENRSETKKLVIN